MKCALDKEGGSMKAMQWVFISIILSLLGNCNVDAESPVLFETYSVDMEQDNIPDFYLNIDQETNSDVLIKEECIENSTEFVEVFVNVEPYNAEVFVDSEFAGVTPFSIDLSLGLHDFYFQQEVCYPHETEICVNKDLIEINITLEEIPELTVHFDSDPPVVEICLLDPNCTAEKTPFSTELFAGSYMLYASKSGYVSKSKEIEVTEENKDFFIQLDPEN